MKENFMISPLGLYIHWPFCIKKCPYCDFNSYAFKYEPEVWVETLLLEMHQGALEFHNYKLHTIFFGGGTPSLIPPKDIKRLIDQAFELWQREEYVEITLETNPSTIETHALEQFMEAGINRFSIGVQSLNDDNLKFLGRLHSAQEAVKIVEHAAKICDNVSTDFIYALPSDTLESWQKDLDKILELADRVGTKHLSLYQLTIENNTAFEQQVEAKLWAPMDEDKQSDLYMHTYATLHNAGWDFYEISNASRLGNAVTNSGLSTDDKQYRRYMPGLAPGATVHSLGISPLTDTSVLCKDSNNENVSRETFELAEKVLRGISQDVELTIASLRSSIVNRTRALCELVPRETFEPVEKVLRGISQDVPRETFEPVEKVLFMIDECSEATVSSTSCDMPRKPAQVVAGGSRIYSQYHSRHNLIYWRYQEYLGIGPGAHSRMIHNGMRIKFNDVKNPYKWLEQVKQAVTFLDGKIDYEELDAQAQFQEKALMGLRLKEGITISEQEMQFIDIQKLEMLIEKGFIRQEDGRYVTSLSGRMCLNAVLKIMMR